MIVATFLIIAILVSYMIFLMLLSLRYKNQLKVLFSFKDNSPARIYHSAQLSGLPLPVERYFRLVLQEGQKYPDTIRIKHGGRFKLALNKPWISIHGEQYFTAVPAGFIWKGNTAIFSAMDMYIGAKGRLEIYLFNAFKIVSGSGEKYDQGELIRWLAESVWFPTNFFQDECRHWYPIDAFHSRLRVQIDGQILNYLVSFNERGEIANLATKRYMEGQLRIWVITLSDYRQINSVTIPFLAEASWKLQGNMFPYARFEVEEVEYDVALTKKVRL